MDNYQHWTLGNLKLELKARGIRTNGRKKDLIERLVSLDKMCVCRMEDVENEYHMDVPPQEDFKDLHRGIHLPPLKDDDVETYFKEHDKSMETKFKELYKKRYIRFVRVASSPGNLTFFQSSVWAEMKKQTTYCVHISLDQHGVIQEAQCECKAGQGPSAHCKHVACTMFAVLSFQSSGELLTERTCTQVLQSFHHAKAHKGSPLTSSGLEKIRNQKLVYDPRPGHTRNDPTYPVAFRNTMLNFQAQHQSSSSRAMPVLQLYQPANMYGVVLDHDYGMSSEEAFLTREKLHQISTEDRHHIEKQTRGQAGNHLWMEARSVRVTASKFGEICKATERKDMDQLVQGMINPVPFKSKATSHGNLYEKVAVKKFEELYGSTSGCGLFVCREYPWLAASPDRVLNDNKIVEIKCPYSAKDKVINPITVPYLTSGINGLELKENHDYFYQVQGQLLCSESHTCYFCVYTLEDVKVIEIVRNEEFIKKMVSNLRHFFDDHFYPALLEKHVFLDYGKYF